MPHGVRRDPDTGQFISSGSSHDFERREALSGTIGVTIPAADNTGPGSTVEQFGGSSTIVIDFEDELDTDEIFHLQTMKMAFSLALPTTATSESSAVVGYAVAKDVVDPINLTTRSTTLVPFSSPDDEQGVLDITTAQNNDDSILVTGALYGEASNRDTVNSTGGGADYANQRDTFSPWSEMSTTIPFDSDDEMAIVGELSTQDVSDHLVGFTAFVTAHGMVERLD